MTRPIDAAPKPVRAVPNKYRNDLYHTVDGYDWVYENSKCTKLDAVKPGFFNAYRDELRVGAVIECRIGSIQDGITQICIQILAAPKEDEGDVMVSVGPSKKFSPCRTDGLMIENKERAA